MKNRVFAITLCLIFVFGCSSEKSKIKKALKSSIPIEQVGNYKFQSYTITETLLKSNIEDTISTLQSSNMAKQMIIDNQIRRREGYQSNLEDWKHQERTTLSWLRSSYDSVIRTWEEMIKEVNEKIQTDSSFIIANNQRIEFFQDYILRLR